MDEKKDILYDLELIDDYLNKSKITKEEFCKSISISVEDLEKVYKHSSNILVEILLKICEKINTRIWNLFFAFDEDFFYE